MMMLSMMRASVIDFHKGKVELLTMDDELPVIIFVILQSKVSNIMT
jgi:hypothetical protein